MRWLLASAYAIAVGTEGYLGGGALCTGLQRTYDIYARQPKTLARSPTGPVAPLRHYKTALKHSGAFNTGGSGGTRSHGARSQRAGGRAHKLKGQAGHSLAFVG